MVKFSDFPIVPANKSSLSRRRPMYGIFVNDADYITSLSVDGKRITCPIFSRWKNMIIRCNDKKYHDKFPTYKDCTIDNQWHSFMSFRGWVLTQSDWECCELDKDLLVDGNNIYGPQFCIFISPHINTFFAHNTRRLSSDSLGVFFHRGNWYARCGGESLKRYYSPPFDLRGDAVLWYQNKRKELAYVLAAKQTNPIIANAIIRKVDGGA